MTRFAHVIKELGRNFIRHPGTAAASLLSLTLMFLLFDLFWIAAGTSEKFYRDLVSELQMELFIAEETSDAALPELHRSLEGVEGALTVQYVSRDDAREKLSQSVGSDLLIGYDSANPLPRSFVLTLTPELINGDDLARLAEELGARSEVREVAYSKAWLNKMETAREIVWNIGMVLGGLILAAALLSSTLSIRLITETRAVGFRQMRILGAGRALLTMPFLLEGLTIGGVAAVSGWALVAFAHQRVTLSKIEIIVPPLQDIAIFCGVAALLGLISGYLGIRKMLK